MNDKSCFNCKYDFKDLNEEPCVDCVDKPRFIKWEPKESEIKSQPVEEHEVRYELVEELTKEEINKIMGRKPGRPNILKILLPKYEHDWSKHPEHIRVSFDDGTTAVYDLHTEQPAPVIIENIKIIRRMAGYTAPRPRRRNRK